MEQNILPPYSLEAEQSVLGGLMIAVDAFDDVNDLCSKGDFYRADHRLIWEAMADCASRNKPRDIVTLSDQLRDQGMLEEAGGIAYLGTLAKDTPSAANICAYARIVREKSILRQVMQAGFEIGGLKGKPQEVLEQAQQIILKIDADTAEDSPTHVKDSLSEWIEDFDRRFHSPDALIGMSTGFTDLDKMTGGFEDGDLIVIAGRPSMGKSALGANIAQHCAFKLGKPAALFSLEMPKRQLITRFVSSHSRIPMQELRRPQRQELFSEVVKATAALNQSPLILDEKAGMTISQLRSRARRAHKKFGLKLIVVDYLQMIVGDGKESRNSEIEEITRGLKLLAKELHIPVIALSQLNRRVEQRPNKRPMMSDLRDGGSIEQDADIIMLAYRDEYYYKDRSPHLGIAEINISKQRNGPVGTIDLTFLGQYCQFENYAGPDHAERMRLYGGDDGSGPQKKLRGTHGFSYQPEDD